MEKAFWRRKKLDQVYSSLFLQSSPYHTFLPLLLYTLKKKTKLAIKISGPGRSLGPCRRSYQNLGLRTPKASFWLGTDLAFVDRPFPSTKYVGVTGKEETYE